jgi:cytochrome c5
MARASPARPRSATKAHGRRASPRAATRSITHAIQGFQGKSGVMPPKGGNTTLSDPDVKAAVDYMISAAK